MELTDYATFQLLLLPARYAITLTPWGVRQKPTPWTLRYWHVLHKMSDLNPVSYHTHRNRR